MSENEFHTMVHNAYESFGPSEAERERVFTSLQEVQAQAPQKPRRLKVWWVVAPLAAAVAVVAVMVSMNSVPAPSPAKSAQADAAAVALQDETTKGSMAQENIAQGDQEEANAITQNATGLSAYLVTLEDGTTFTVGKMIGELPACRALEQATAADEQAGTTRGCYVADRAYVCFEGEDVWYELEKAV